jgi:hypothetical protein
MVLRDLVRARPKSATLTRYLLSSNKLGDLRSTNEEGEKLTREKVDKNGKDRTSVDNFAHVKEGHTLCSIESDLKALGQVTKKKEMRMETHNENKTKQDKPASMKA